jgi:aminoglycoside phosphotransferase (APT) family kinase protein
MRVDEVQIDERLVQRLLETQFPAWASLPLTRVESHGTDNAIYRLGDQMAVRMPRYPGAVGQVEKEARWLPELAPHLPLEVPAPLALGEPGEGYPWRWAVVSWLPGEPASLDRVEDAADAAVRLAGLVAAMQAIDPTGGPGPGDHNFGRGEPLQNRAEEVGAALAQVGDLVDTEAASRVWAAALAAPVWHGPPVWIHGDLQGSNMLVRDGTLSAVVDFGALGVGDPACDVMAAWIFLPPEARSIFRAGLDVDDDTWERARGWALSMGLIALPYYRETNPTFARNALGWIEDVLSDRHG